jgi:hypothetical protein
MIDSKVNEFITDYDWENFNKLFDLKSKNELLYFTDFTDIVCSFDGFDSHALSDILVSLKKKIREKMKGFADNELLVSKLTSYSVERQEYFEFLQTIAIEVNQFENINDTGLSIII